MTTNICLHRIAKVYDFKTKSNAGVVISGMKYFLNQFISVPTGKHQDYRFRKKAFNMYFGTTISYVSR
ncbi:hypothetical protein [Caldalkalibacillus mannanilyticus]|uniref:hypothetical protein n=1 Tax=Caldalkalibacillus mannanilyticus TaxID=1418 RepID=UPI000468E197|nr:hypothetical protein [Caldalkalibacillus mannanilyticus]